MWFRKFFNYITATYAYNYDIYVGAAEVGLPETASITATLIHLFGTFCGDIEGKTTTHAIHQVSCQDGPLEGRYVQIVTKSAVYIHMYELYIHIVDYYGRQ